ncbi:hypothetical protein ACXYRR_02635 [Mycoplasma sp. 246B]
MKYSQSVAALNSYISLSKLDSLVKNGMKHIHIDFMDGVYVSNFGVTFYQAEFLINRYKNVHFDAHLMLSNPYIHIKKLINIGFKTIFIPMGMVNTEFYKIKNDYPHIDFGIILQANDNPINYKNIIINSQKILLMTIDVIGRTGQKLNPKLLDKTKTIKNINSNIKIYSDGGLRKENAYLFSLHNIDVAIGGSIIYSFADEKDFCNWWKDNF